MLTLTLLALFFVIVAATWFMGLWGNLLTLINVILAATIASGYFGVVANALDNTYNRDTGQRFVGPAATYTYLLDFLVLWGLFYIAFVVLRIFTDILSRYRVRFNIWVEMIGRSVFAIAIAWVFICFATFTLHTAPMPLDAFNGGFQATPETRNFMGIGPDRMWMAYVQSRSKGALAAQRNKNSSPREWHPDDAKGNSQVFDSKSEFIFKYRHRRAVFSELEAERVGRQW